MPRRKNILDECYVIHVPSFDEHNSKAAGKPTEWLRLNSRIVHDARFKGLSSAAKHLWLYLLCECARNAKREALLHQNVSKSDLHCTQKSLKSALKVLSDLQWIQILRAPIERTNERTNVASNDALFLDKPIGSVNNNEIQVETPLLSGTEEKGGMGEKSGRRRKAPKPAPAFDFESVYQTFPRKEGKSLGLKKCAKVIRTAEDFERFKLAAHNYRRKVRIEGTERQFIKKFSNWMEEWEDYVDWQPPAAQPQGPIVAGTPVPQKKLLRVEP